MGYGRRAWVREAAALSLVLAGALIIYHRALFGFFVQDDFGWLVFSRFQTVGDYLGSFFRLNPALGYRPLSQEGFFWLGQKLFGLWPGGFHAVSLAFHLLGAALVYGLARSFFSPVPSLVGALFYAVHATHFRSVYWISALPEPMALVFFLAALGLFIVFDRHDNRVALAGSIISMLLGVGSKESILTLPLVMAAYCVFFSRKRLLWTTPFFLVSAVYTLVRVTQAAQSSPYPLAFDWVVLQNLEYYFAWAIGFTETLLKLKFGWRPEATYPVGAVIFILATVVLMKLSANRKAAYWSLVWFAISLQPVLYFEDHIEPYYLAPCLAAYALLIASALPAPIGLRDWRALLPAVSVAWLSLALAQASVSREGAWWNERSYVARNIVEQVRQIDCGLPPAGTAFIFGLRERELGALDNNAALAAHGLSVRKFVVVGLYPETPSQILSLAQTGGLSDSHCFLYARGQFFDMTAEFRRSPGYFLVPVGLDIQPREVEAGKDQLTFRISNFAVPAIDLAYTVDGRPMPPILDWRLDPSAGVTLAVDSSTQKGVYHFTGMRDARNDDPTGWYPTDVRVMVR